MSSHRGRLELTWTNKDRALISTGEGRYDYAFVDPNDPRVLEVRLLHEVERISAPTPADRPAELPRPTDDNLLITGDAMHALDAMISIPEYARRYAGQVKLVYIDPPFNTGQAFEHYEDNIEHSIWLTMLRDRLKQIKRLLRADGSVWVHLDDVEVHRCRAILDEQLGAECFVAQIAWEKGDSPRMDAQQFSERHDTILVYSARPGWRPNRFASTAALSFPQVDENGRAYRAPGPLRKWGANSDRADRPNLWYPLIAPDGTEVWPIKSDGKDGYWRWKREVAEERAGDLHWEDKGSGMQPYVKEYADEARKPIPPESLWPNTIAGHNREAKAEIKALFGSEAFSTPKPERLLERVIHIGTAPGDIVLDCFAGSGTTAAVAHKMGRRWVTSELQAHTVETFTRRRLERVVRGEDPGGITTTSERVVAEGVDLPDGMSVQEAAELNRLLSKVAKSIDDLDPSTIRAIRAATKTVPSVRKAWHGGGSFTHMKVGPSMYEIDEDGDVFLAPAATNGLWSRSVAAQLRFTLTPDHPVFCGVRGRQRLAVIDGVADEIVVKTVLESLGDRERAVIVAKAVLPEASELLAAASPGSRIRKAPDDLFPKRTVK